ncbi:MULTISPECIES: hypothetical protein [Halomicrobium]|uniref:Uncharacterized protein n=2 Tax=Halomicrobium mukohataei TaxID=57705 RepID=C7P3C4_HALMD|nr:MULTISPECIES: hypothetical protein [Halomicrobium]ACV47596.1 hypothetical protein Hmuk_1481 [Halomicrobium mukohataei DSM 12286]QCD66058.1 hypothetical protein E5139_10550 [Halomicrobium mukohataei]QFR20863.1 hypothetical protein GBQ70_10545 [Halomicrobium sp. ZPS1]
MDAEERSITAYLEAAAEEVARLPDGSHTIQIGQSLTGWITDVTRESSLYRWLTKEPDPEVMVIDLAETYTVGPFIRLLDRLIPYVERAWNGSVLKRTTARTAELVRDVPIKVASVLFIAVLLAQTIQLLPSIQNEPTTTLGIHAVAWLLALGGLRVDWTLEELSQSRVGRLTRALLEPPEPPDDD